jgi:hypothetical protein
MSLSVISWLVGIIVNTILLKTPYYKKLSNFNFIPSKKVNDRIGIKYIKWIVKNTPFKFFNQSIKIKNKQTDLSQIRHEMTIAEIGHLVGFVFVTGFVIYRSFTLNLVFGFFMMLANIIMNLYPSLLQQENKRRIGKLIKRQKIKH